MLPPIGGKIDSGKFLFAPSSFFLQKPFIFTWLVSLCAVQAKKEKGHAREQKHTQGNTHQTPYRDTL